MSNLRLIKLFTLMGVVSLAPIVTIPTSLPLDISSSASASQPRRVRWVPNKKMGSVRSTLSGGRRGQPTATCDYGTGTKPTVMTLLVPAHQQGLVTTASSPAVFWHMDTSKPVSMKFILSDPKSAQPIFTQDLEAKKSGIAQVDLPSTLKVGTNYRWTVLVACKGSAASEVSARSFIERVDTPSLSKTAIGKSDLEQAATYAKAGVWYDALDSLMRAYFKNPQSPYLKAELKSLLSQAGSNPIEQITDRISSKNTPS